MFEKIKDMWYDVSDFLITFIIILFIVGSIAFIMTNSLGVDFALSDYLTFLRDKPAPSVVVEEPPAPSPSPMPSLTPSEPAETATEPESPAEPQTTPAEPQQQTIMLTVNPGDMTEDVAAALLREQLITSEDEFLSEVARQGLDTSLQIGTFELRSGMTLQEIINTLF